MLNTNPFGFNTPQELNSLPSTELNWQNKLSGQIAGLFRDSLDHTKKFSSYLGSNFEKNNLTGLGDSIGKVLQGDFKGGLNAAVKGLGIDKGITQGMSGVAKGITGVGNVAGLANTALDMFGVGQIDRRTQSTGSKALGTFNKYSGVLMGTPFAPLATIGALAGTYDKVFAKSADKQGTADMSNIGYNTIINPLAGAKVGGWDRLRGRRGGINRDTTKVDGANSEAYAIGSAHKQNTLASQNTTGVLQDKNYQQMMGGYGTNILAARLGTKVPPVNLRNIVNKAEWSKKKKLEEQKKKLKASKVLEKDTKYKDGGLLNKTDREEVIEEVVEEKKNVIPEGAFHSRKNNIHEDVAKHVTHKGIPVITKDEEGKITQHAEVERNEIIFHKEATDTIETLHEKFKKADTQKLKDEIMIECGKYVADQILVNTDDRTGIIETIE